MSELTSSNPNPCPIPPRGIVGAPKVYHVDLDPETRQRVKAVANSIDIEYEFADCGEDLLRPDRVPPLGPGCVVSEFRLRGINGLELQAEMKRYQPAMPFIFLTAFAETALTVQAMQNGALHVLEKPFSAQQLCDLLRRSFESALCIWRIDEQHRAIRQRLKQLTTKEQQVLSKLLDGRSNKQIAGDLDISIRTVEARRHEIFKKTGTTSVAELVRTIMEVRGQD